MRQHIAAACKAAHLGRLKPAVTKEALGPCASKPAVRAANYGILRQAQDDKGV